MRNNTTLQRSTVAHDGTTYAVSTVHVVAQGYYETCLFSPRRQSRIVDEYSTEHDAHTGHQRWVNHITDHGWPPDTECHECAATITDGHDANSTVTCQHSARCSLHPDDN
jgi:hypothetical protein